MGHEEVRHAYAAVAKRYIDLFGAIERVHEDDLAFIRRHLGRLTGPVLDLGCGPGHLTGYLRSIGVDAIGIDLVPEFIDHATTAHPGVRFTVGSMTALDAPDHSVAGILAWYSLIHLPPPGLDDALAAFRRALAPDGILVVGLFDGDDIATFDHKVIKAHRWPADEISRRLARIGLAERERLHRPAHGDRRGHIAIAAQAS